jgi:hypothetical protein
LTVAETWPHLSTCRLNRDPATRITQVQWQEINRARAKQDRKQREKDEREFARFMAKRRGRAASR